MMSSAVLSLLCPGGPDKPSLSAWPSPIVPQGGRVVLRCDSPRGLGKFKLYKKDETRVPEIQDRIFWREVLLEPVTPAHAGTYRCSAASLHAPHRPSALSDPLVLTITGVYRKPFLLAQPGPLVESGGKVTLLCGSQIMYETFTLVLHRDGVAQDPLSLTGQHQDGGAQASFSVGPVTATHAGTYSCFGSHSYSPYEWSAPSDPVDLVITGLYEKPSLSAQLGPAVRPGENVTLSCSSERPFTVYYLSREGEPRGPQFTAAQSHEGGSQADFPLGPGALGGTYRCYGSFRGSGLEWSAPSEPLHLPVPGNSSSSCPPPADPGSRADGPERLQVLSGLWAPVLLVAVLLVLLGRRRCSAAQRSLGDAAGAAPRDREPEAGGADPQPEEAQEETYTELDHWVSAEKRSVRASQRPRKPSVDATVYMELVKR